MKKFHKLIQNRVQHKNTLLKADITRLYPICSYKANHSPTNFSDFFQVLSPTSPFEPKKSLLSDRNLKSREPTLQNIKDISLPGLNSGKRSSRNTYKSQTFKAVEEQPETSIVGKRSSQPNVTAILKPSPCNLCGPFKNVTASRFKPNSVDYERYPHVDTAAAKDLYQSQHLQSNESLCTSNDEQIGKSLKTTNPSLVNPLEYLRASLTQNSNFSLAQNRKSLSNRIQKYQQFKARPFQQITQCITESSHSPKNKQSRAIIQGNFDQDLRMEAQ